MSSLKDKFKISTKHGQVDKAYTVVVISVSLAAVITIFSLVGIKNLSGLIAYQQKVINKRNEAAKQLKDNIAAAKRLDKAYTTFDSAPTSLIGTSDRNSKIVLDALPSKYDFPALVTSMEGLVTKSGVKRTELTGNDEEKNAVQSSASPTAVEVPLDVGVSGSFEGMETFVKNLEKSIRPFVIESFEMSGKGTALNLKLSTKTYYQPEKTLQITDQIVSQNDTGQKAFNGKKVLK